MKRLLFLGLFFIPFCGIDAQYLQLNYAGDPLPDKDKVWIERFLAYEIDFYSQFGLSDTTHLQLTIFDKRQDALDYLGDLKVPLFSLQTSGMYLPKRKEAVVLGREKWREKSSKIVINGLTYHLNRQTIKQLPGWLNVGLAEYFEHCELGKKGLKHSLGNYELGRIRTMYMLGEIDLKSFINNAQGDFRKKLHNDENYAYVLSHALVTFCLEIVEKDFMKNLLSSLNKKDGNRVSYQERINSIYPGGFGQFEQDFSDFCNRD